MVSDIHIFHLSVKKMKILFFVDSFQGGAGNVIQILAVEFKKRGYDCTIFLANRKIVPPKYDLKGIKVIEVDLNKEAPGKMPFDRIIRQKNYIHRLFNKEKPDVVISFLTENNILSCMAKDRKLPLFISERIDPAKANTKIHWRILRWLEYGKANKVVLQCSNFADFCGGKFKSITEIVPNPILMPTHLHTVDFSDHTITFISMGRLTGQKNFPWMFEQMARIHEKVPNSVLHIYGNGGEKDKLNQMIHEKGWENFIQIVGYADEPYEILSKADVYLMTSDYEGFPNALSEAMAVGLPSVSRKCHDGISDLVRDGVNGYLVNPDDKASFVELAVELAMNTDLRKEISDEAKKVSTTFGVEAISDIWEKLIRGA